jgi:hypothetical protein
MTTAALLAGLAVAYLLWTRPAVAPALPPLPPLTPIIPPGIMPLGMPGAAAGGGPHPLTLLAILAAGGMVAFAIRETRTPPPGPGPAPVVGLDLRGRFVGPDAAADAATTAALLEELAGQIEWDGQQAEPRLSTGAAFDDLRRAARELRTRGVSLGARQPAVRDAIKAYLDAQVGTEGGPVDVAGRARWVKGLRDVSAASLAAVSSVPRAASDADQAVRADGFIDLMQVCLVALIALGAVAMWRSA